jgi:hypothetical protein
MVIHPALVVAVHVQPEPVDTEIAVPVPPDAPMENRRRRNGGGARCRSLVHGDGLVRNSQRARARGPRIDRGVDRHAAIPRFRSRPP